MALLLATALAPLAVDAPRAPSAVGAPLSGTAVASPPPPLPAAAAWGLALEPSCPASFVAAHVLLSCDPLLPTAGCCNALLGSVPRDDALPCLCAAAHDPDLQRAGYMEGDCCSCQEAHITQTTIPQAGSASHRRIQKEVAGSCDASKLAWDVAVNCVNSLDGEEVKVTPSCCTPFLAAAESRRCFCSFLQELKVELSPISRKDAHLLHRRCGGLHPLPRCFSHRDGRARRRAAGTVGDKVADLGLQAAEIGLEAVAKKLEQKEQDSSSSPPQSAGTRSRGTSMDSSPSSEEDHKEELQEEEEKTSKPQACRHIHHRRRRRSSARSRAL
ncbi:hypothetical protein TRIUR3_13218 [Triticum urartu]|uniref:Bifunctional inhibitor/plant lipid transfer protein/seed storage helical domain-containing protein n=1 Tax=Triticum urartu TaxID=4572 RepID=M7YUN3_TRIUA|nr:hypothetical protein TRIUR3_13218 [Triticum urartu]